MSLLSLFSSSIPLAHHYWSLLLRPGDCVCDATCGNGHDTLFLAQRVLSSSEIDGTVFALDIQSTAVAKTKKRLKEALLPKQMDNISFYTQCHTSFPPTIKEESLSLVVYNLGYLPGGNKDVITETGTTVTSLKKACTLLKIGGALSITCYPGHAKGGIEEKAIFAWAASLAKDEWQCCSHRWENRRRAPSLLLITKQQRPSLIGAISER